jgi:hypothetical protein
MMAVTQPASDTSPRSFRRRATIVGVTLVVFLLASRLQLLLYGIPWYRNLYERFPFYVPETLKSSLAILLVLATVIVLRRTSLAGAISELGIRRPEGRMIGILLLATLPMWLVFAFTTPLVTDFGPATVFYLAFVSPLAEEVVFRGFAFRQLYRYASLGFWPSILLTSAVFSVVHLAKASSPGQMLGIAAITFVGGAFFAWLFVRWKDQLLAPLLIHVLMNLAWQIFAVGETAFAGWLPTIMQASVLVLAVVLTVVSQRRWTGRQGQHESPTA